MRDTGSAESPAARTVVVQLGIIECMVLEDIRQDMLADGFEPSQCTPEAVLLECLWAFYQLQRSLEELDHEQEP